MNFLLTLLIGIVAGIIDVLPMIKMKVDKYSCCQGRQKESNHNDDHVNCSRQYHWHRWSFLKSNVASEAISSFHNASIQ